MEHYLQPAEENKAAPVTTDQQAPVSPAAGQQEAASLDELLSRLQREVTRRNRYGRLFLSIWTPYFCLYIFYVFNRSVHSIDPPWLFHPLMVWFFTLLMWALNTWIFKESTARTVTELDDIRVVGLLADILGMNKGHFKFKEQTMNLVKLALIRLLPRLQASDAHLLNVEQRKSLCRALNDKSSKLVLAILKAFEQVGDAEALPYVQKLAEGKGRARTEKRIQEAAQACLPFLSRLAEQTQARQTLLRAAGTSQAAEGALLRPASGAPTTDSSQLLRTEWPSERD